jgi:chitinase
MRIAPLAISVCVLLGSGTLAAETMVVAYVPNWINVKTFAERIDYAALTHINIAFENPTNDAGEMSFNKANDTLIAKARAAKVKILVSICGGAASSNKILQARYFELISADKRAKFAATLAKYVEEHQLDGLDIDLEGPAINKDYGAFIEELSKLLKPRGKLLTAALSQGYGGNNVPDAALKHFDLVHIMAYDGAGPWNKNAPGQHSSMDLAKKGVAYWLKRGVPKERLTLGVPFYGYGFGEDFRKSAYAYDDIVAKHPGAEQTDQTGNTIWYNGIPTIQAKTKFAREEGIGGLMIWSLDNDAPGDKSLLRAMRVVIDAK